MISDTLRNAIKLSDRRQYELALVIKVSPGTLSAWLNRIYSPQPGDPRVFALARMVGVDPDDAFEE